MSRHSRVDGIHHRERQRGPPAPVPAVTASTDAALSVSPAPLLLRAISSVRGADSIGFASDGSSSLAGFGAGLAEEREGPAQLPAGAVQSSGRFIEIATMQEQHRDL